MTLLISAGEYKLNANVTPVLHPKGSYRVRMASTMSCARHPNEERTVLDINLDAAAVRRLAYALLVAVDADEVSHMNHKGELHAEQQL